MYTRWVVYVDTYIGKMLEEAICVEDRKGVKSLLQKCSSLDNMSPRSGLDRCMLG